MIETKSQMRDAQTQFITMLRSSALFVVPCLLLLLACEICFRTSAPTLSLGTTIGCAYALLNLALLFWFLAPYFFTREKPAHVLFAALISMSLGACMMFTAMWFDMQYAMGLALGVAMPAACGLLLLELRHPA